MRTGRWLAGVALSLGLTATASAQQRSVFLMPSQGSIQNQVIDTSNAGVPIAQPMTLPSSSNSLTRFFPSFNRLVNRKPIQATTVYPTADQLPGKDYLKAFRFQHPPRIGQ
jgi:hypothetical protein